MVKNADNESRQFKKEISKCVAILARSYFLR